MAIEAKNKVAPFDGQQLEAIAKILADTSSGLTGSEIGHLLRQNNIEDPNPDFTKWKRLYNAFITFQNRNNIGNHVLVFIMKAMNPAAHIRSPEIFEQWRGELNSVLSLTGMEVKEDGKIKRVTKATTLNEALERANRFKSKLERRGVHSEVFQYCKVEIISENYFHAVFEALKSISAKIRNISSLDGDGHDLYDRAFALGKDNRPILKINTLTTETQRGEQRGFLNLLKGLYGTVRNPIGHEAKIEWEMNEEDALDIMTTVSFVHRKLDKTQVMQDT